MNVDRLFAVVGSALDAQRQRLNIIAGNLANAQSTRTPNGGPYVRRDVVFQSVSYTSPFQQVFSAAFGGPTDPNGVRISRVISDPRPPRRIYDPHHPDADKRGFVAMPNVNVIEEMTNLLTTSRSYEANLAVLDTGKAMALRVLDLAR
ncbi:MAG: flagellar basal body rod protein FlgC [Nitrospirae bacterium]|nr:MAG: flagellar basal body rod protein FlgC [Nitrospirota bacterium]